jgi:hypothetical protein
VQYKELNWIEQYAGEGMATQCMGAAGYQSVKLDKEYFQTVPGGVSARAKENFYDILTDSGFAPLGRAIIGDGFEAIRF